jgi:hypothetical protein
MDNPHVSRICDLLPVLQAEPTTNPRAQHGASGQAGRYFEIHGRCL